MSSPRKGDTVPHPTWRHTCSTGEVVQAVPECAACGDAGTFNGWHLSMREAMAVYRYVYDLDPVGPHRPFADRLFAGMRDTCARCLGRTLLTFDDGKAWSTCPACEGTGGMWNCPDEDIAAARQAVLARWPGAAMATPAAKTAKPAGRSPRRRPKGSSTHGLRFADVVRAFALAERILGANWQIKGRGHCRRATLTALYSSHALKGAARSWTRVRPHQAMTWKRLMPVAIIEKAAELLGVPAALLMAREY